MFKQKLGAPAFSDRKTIAIVANSSWNIYNFRLNLIRTLKQEGFRIIVIAPVDEYIHYLNETKLVQHIPIKHLKPHHKNPLRDLRLSLELYRIYRIYKPDLVLHYTIKPNIFGSLAARWAKTPTIATITGLGYTFLKKNWINKIVRQLYKVAFRKINKVIFHNEDDRLLFIKEGLVDPLKATVIPGSGVDINHFRPMLKPDSQKFIFLFVGRLLFDKGLKETVQAVKALKKVTANASCWVIGEISPGNPSSIPKQLILDWMQEGSIKYFGQVKDVRTIMNKVDVVVLPSYREGIPRAILEAMAMGKPIITTDVAGCRETVKSAKNGYLVPAKDVHALYQAMLKCYQANSEDLGQMGEESREKVRRSFSTAQINQSYLQLIQEELNERKKVSEKTLAFF